MKHNVGDVLQKIYDSEINIRLSWEWDGGVVWETDITFDKCLGGSGVAETVEAAVEEMSAYISTHYPGSEFEKWFNAAKGEVK